VTTIKSASSTTKPASTTNTESSTTQKPNVTEVTATSEANIVEPEPFKSVEQIIDESPELKKQIEKQGSRKILKKLKKDSQERSLKPFQAELILMQKYLEATKRGMIILFEGRDASGKGGTIRRVARYMNEKHYRIVALGKPNDAQRTQWFFQRYVENFPRGGEVVLFDRSWYNRAMVEPVFWFLYTG